MTKKVKDKKETDEPTLSDYFTSEEDVTASSADASLNYPQADSPSFGHTFNAGSVVSGIMAFLLL